MSNAASDAAGPRTETFNVPMGRYLGYVVVVVAFAMIVVGVVTEGTGSVGLVGFCVAFAMVAWVVLIRPQVSAHADGLLLRNMVRDVYLPWASIRTCKVAQTLQVAAGDRIYHGLGISRSARRIARDQRRMRRQLIGPGSTGMGPLRFFSAPMDGPDPSDPRPQVNMARQEQTITNNYRFAEERIETLAAKGASATVGRRPSVAWDVPAVGALVVAVLAIVIAVVV